MSNKNLLIIQFLVWILFLTVGCLDNTGGVSSDNDAYPSKYVKSAKEIHRLIQTERPPLVLEISKPEVYAAGHLPNAINLWRPDYGDQDNYPYGGMRATKDQMTQLLRRLGVREDDLIVVYCTKGSADATRMLWLLRGYGWENAAIMDGGKKAWELAGYKLVTELPPPRPATEVNFPKASHQVDYASLHDVVAGMTDTNTIILDTRELYEYNGTPYLAKGKVNPFKPGAYCSGTIPGAIHLNWVETVDFHGNHTFKPIAELRSMYEQIGVTPDRRIIAFCQSGVRSAHTAFVLSELLGYPNVMNYDGSWIEWSFLHSCGDIVKIEQKTSTQKLDEINQRLNQELLSSTVN